MRFIVILMTILTLCVLKTNEKKLGEIPKELDFESDVLNVTSYEKGLLNLTLSTTQKTFKRVSRGGSVCNVTKEWLNTTSSSLLSEDFSDCDNRTIGNFTTRSFGSGMETMAGLISKSVYLKMELIKNSLNIPLCISSVVLNVLNCAVFLDKSMRNVTNDYLAGIGIIQILYALFTISDEILIRFVSGGADSAIYQTQKLYIESFVLVVFRRVVYWLVMIVAFERMVAIISPLKRETFKFVKSPVKCIIILTAVTFIFHIFSPLKFSVLDSSQNDTISFIIKRTGFDQNVIESFSLLSQIVFVYVPTMGILVFNIVLCVALYRHVQSMGSLRCNGVALPSSRDRQTTIAIIISTIIFFFLAMPLVTNAFLMNILPNYNIFSENLYTFMFMHQFGILLNLTSFSTDFITYITISSRFRDTLLRKCIPSCISKRYAVKTSRRSVNVSTKTLKRINTISETTEI